MAPLQKLRCTGTGSKQILTHSAKKIVEQETKTEKYMNAELSFPGIWHRFGSADTIFEKEWH